MPKSHYSLLVSECEKWLPELNQLLAQFSFIPDWRIDDLMISYASEHGSVGPHVDQYDVFLLQAMGSRRWQYGDRPCSNDTPIPNLELAILQEFEPQCDEVLSPGDILYLPPGYAHHGVALEPCMTYSIGFRAPDATTVLESLLLEAEQRGQLPERYRDPDLESNRHRSEITDHEIDRLRELVSRLLEQPRELWRNAAGKLLSDSAASAAEDTDLQAVGLQELKSCDWIRHPETRLLFHQSDDSIQIFCNGQSHRLPAQPAILEAVQNLCEDYILPRDLIERTCRIPELARLLSELATRQAILPLNDDLN